MRILIIFIFIISFLFLIHSILFHFNAIEAVERNLIDKIDIQQTGIIEKSIVLKKNNMFSIRMQVENASPEITRKILTERKISSLSLDFTIIQNDKTIVDIKDINGKKQNCIWPNPSAEFCIFIDDSKINNKEKIFFENMDYKLIFKINSIDDLFVNSTTKLFIDYIIPIRTSIKSIILSTFSCLALLFILFKLPKRKKVT